MLTLTTGPVTIDELNEQMKHANEVYYASTPEKAAEWIKKTEALEERNGRPNTTFRIGKVGRRVAVFVDRSQN